MKKKSFLNSNLFDISLMVLPLLFLLIFSGFPIIYTVMLSFQEVNPVQINRLFHEFVGFYNYAEVFADYDFLSILKNTVIFLIASVFFQLFIGLALAILFQRDFLGAKLMRGLFMVPWIMPGLVVGAIWSWIFFEKGILNYALTQLHIIEHTFSWLATPSTSLWTIIIANIWIGIPFNMLMLSASLADIPKDLYEAAKIDGASMIQRFTHITLPLMKTPLFSIMALGIIFTLQQFDLFSALTGGGPSNTSNVLQLWSWKFSFEEYEYGKGAAVASLLMAFMFVMSFVYVLFSSKSDKKG